MARRCSTLRLPIGKDEYNDPVTDPDRFRAWLDRSFRSWPELSPEAFRQGYRLKDGRTPARTGLRLRRIRPTATGESFSARPSFLLPYGVGTADQARGPLFLRAFGAPFWALARAFGRDDMYWYRLEVGLGRNSIVGTTARRAALPEHLLADEHHQTRHGVRHYSATTVGAGCCLGAEPAPAANADDRTAAYGVFEREAREAQPTYRPETVSVGGWASTHQAWVTLFPLVALLRWFLHGGLNLRSRGKLSTAFRELSGKVWEAYHAPDRRRFAHRLRRLLGWARGQGLSAWLLGQVEKVCGRSGGTAWRTPTPAGTARVTCWTE